ncbi:hypothetical protein ACFT8P_28405 [Streptomyces sp. NPDC057101]|uniref:hypothetical protein n=1 Tax=Streptomyces sp. NPDC057101 TaxID=3346020 RepID=UPI003633F749
MAEPLAIADSATNLIITMMSNVGGVLDVQDSGERLNTIPDTHLETARWHNETKGSYVVDGCWFTHTRLYRLAEAVGGGVRTGRGMVNGALDVGSKEAKELAQEVKQSKLVAAVLPFRMSFQVISYTMAGQAQEFATRAIAASANMGLAAAAYQADLQRMDREMKKIRDKKSPEYEHLVAKRAKAVREFEMRRKRVEAIEKDSLERAKQVAESPTQYAIVNFRLRATGGEPGKPDRYVSSGIKVDRSSLQAIPVPGLWMEVGLNWNETALPFYHRSWGGDLLVKLNDQGEPSITSYGNNKFFSRFLSTSSGITPFDENHMYGDGSIADLEAKERIRIDREDRPKREAAAKANREHAEQERRAAEEAEAKKAQAKTDADLKKAADKHSRWERTGREGRGDRDRDRDRREVTGREGRGDRDRREGRGDRDRDRREVTGREGRGDRDRRKASERSKREATARGNEGASSSRPKPRD